MRTHLAFLLLITASIAAPLNAEVFTDADGNERCRYTISLAKNTNAANPAGVIFALHPNGGSDGPMVGHTRNMLKKLKLGNDYTVVAVKSIASSWTKSFTYKDNNDLKNIMDLYAHLAQHMPLDKRRVMVWGFSGGGMTACLLAVNKPKFVHTTISMGGYGFDNVKVAQPFTHAPLFYSMAGDKDPNWGFIERALPKQEKGGLHWISYLVTGVGHTMSGNQLDALLQDALQLGLSRRNANVAISASDAQLVADASTRLDQGAKLKAAELLQLARIGGATAAPVTLALLKHSDARVVGSGVQLAMSGAQNPAVLQTLVELARSGEERKVMGPALTALAQFARWRYPTAVTGLADMLSDSTLADNRRKACLTAVADAVKLARFGPRRDHAALWTALETLSSEANTLGKAAAKLLQQFP